MPDIKKLDLPTFIQQLTAQVARSTKDVATDSRVSGEVIIKIRLNQGGIMGACVSIEKLIFT